MDQETPRADRPRVVVAVFASIAVHLGLALALLFMAGTREVMERTRPGEPLMVELSAPEPLAPAGNPAAREVGPPAAGPPAVPGPARRSTPSGTAAVPAPVRSATPTPPPAAPAPSPPLPPVREPERPAAPSVAAPVPVETPKAAPEPPRPVPEPARPALAEAPNADEKSPVPQSAEPSVMQPPTPEPTKLAQPPEPMPVVPEAPKLATPDTAPPPVVTPPAPERPREAPAAPSLAREASPGDSDRRPGDSDRRPGVADEGQRVASVPAAPGGVGGGLPGGPAAPPDIRTALRAVPGGGGAGGRAAGRGGIEGEPIPLDSKDGRYNDYFERIRRMIKAKWHYPCVRNMATRECDYRSANLVVEFGILQDGRLQFVDVRRSSGEPIYDDYAVNAIKLASPFPEIPSTMLRTGSTGLPILATFNYVAETSLVNLLR